MKATRFDKHTLLQAKMSILRDKKTPPDVFARTMDEISYLLCALVSTDIEVKKTSVITPLMRTTGTRVARRVILVPILRAGLGLLQGFKALLPDAAVGHVGVERDHSTLKPKFYYFKTPPLRGHDVWVLDPMLATGGSLDFTLEKLKEHMPNSIRAISILAAPEGIAVIEKAHPDIRLYVGTVDQKLNQHGYIVPGLGDAGDRYFNT
jgi:uracil phosphoribosyltransferase